MSVIKLSDLANRFQDGLNAILANPEIQFKIWSEAGEYQAFQRKDNTITWFINGNLRRVTSSNDANDLVMGVNGLSLDFVIPIKQPRTNTAQTEEELARIQDGQFPFVEYITNAINAYFAKAQSFMLTINDGTEADGTYSVAFRAGMATTGAVDLVPVLGECIGVSVYVEVYYIQNGVNSKGVTITVDGEHVPYQALRWGRSPMVERSVYAGKLVSKNVISSTAFAIDVDLPVNAKLTAGDPIATYLLDGTPNVAHFVNLTINGTEYNYFMTVNSAQSSAQGISIAGTSVSYMEISDGYYSPGVNRMGIFILPNSQVKKITAQISVTDNLYDGVFLANIGGKCGKYPVEDFKVDITPEMVRYNKEDNIYYVPVVFAYPLYCSVNQPQADGQSITYQIVN